MQGMIFIDQSLELIVFLIFYFDSSQAVVSNNKFRIGGSERDFVHILDVHLSSP